MDQVDKLLKRWIYHSSKMVEMGETKYGECNELIFIYYMEYSIFQKKGNY